MIEFNLSIFRQITKCLQNICANWLQCDQILQFNQNLHLCSLFDYQQCWEGKWCYLEKSSSRSSKSISPKFRRIYIAVSSCLPLTFKLFFCCFLSYISYYYILWKLCWESWINSFNSFKKSFFGVFFIIILLEKLVQWP